MLSYQFTSEGALASFARRFAASAHNSRIVGSS